MKIRIRTLIISVSTGALLAALAVFGGVAEAACAGSPPAPPAPPTPCSRPADGCAIWMDERLPQAWCCKDVEPGSCYWVDIRAICCGTQWKWKYTSGTMLGFNCGIDNACY